MLRDGRFLSLFKRQDFIQGFPLAIAKNNNRRGGIT